MVPGVAQASAPADPFPSGIRSPRPLRRPNWQSIP